jgi:HD-GYP domain-containing protein (c-di-GMP phosphodiesterase class II)
MGEERNPRELLSLVLDAAREMSRYDEPAQVSRIALEQGRKILRYDRFIAVTRRDMEPREVRITRSDAPGTDFHDPTGYEEFPPITRGLIPNLLYAGESRLIDELSLESDDPAGKYFDGMRSLAAIPHFRGGEAVDMVFHLRHEPNAYKPERFAELALISSLFGQAIHHLARARQSAEAEKNLKEQYDIIAKLSTNVMNSAMDLKHDNEVLEVRVRERTRELTEANIDAIYMLAIASEAKDEDTGAHVKRIFRLTRQIASALGMNDRQAEDLAYASVLHDVGKIHVPDQILKKPGPLTNEEWTIMREHTIVGERILSDKPFFHHARKIARSHHENWDGSGYPDATRGDAIPMEARIVHLADVYDALTSPRVYKAAWSQSEAMDFIRESSGHMFDPKIVQVFDKVLGQAPAPQGELLTHRENGS